MNRLPAYLMIVLAPALAASASTAREIVTKPVGPVPLPSHQSAPKSTRTGFLEVYTATELVSNGGVSFRPRTDYTILSADGKVFRKVVNSVAYQDAGPANVELPAGTYTVVGDGEFYSSVRVPVVVEPGRTTLVHLDGGWTRSVANAAASDLVKLPNGEVVGWRADVAGAASTQ